MTYPLLILAGLAALGGALGIPLIHGWHLLHNWLEPVLHLDLGEVFIASEQMLREHGHHVPHWSDLLEPAEHNVGWEVSLMFFSLAVALSGIGMAYLCYIKFPELPDKIMDGQWGYDLVKNKYMVDEMYDEAIVKPTVNGSKLLWTECDAKGIDGAVNGVAQTIGWFSRLAQIYQSGYVRNYALFMVVGFISLLLIVL